MGTQADYIEALSVVQTHAENVVDKMKESPGGDCYIFTGAMNDVEALKDAIRHCEILREECENDCY